MRLKLAPKAFVFVTICTMLVFVSMTALAQAVGPIPVTAVNPTSVVIATLAFLVAFLANAHSSGSFFGLVTVPKAAIPIIGVVVPAISAIYMSISSAGNLSLTTVFNAVQAGLFALLASAGGAATHNALSNHVSLPGAVKATRAAAASAATKAAVVLMLLGVLGATQTACGNTKAIAPVVTPAGSCVLDVIQDALAGMTVDQILAKEGTACITDAAEVWAILSGAAQQTNASGQLIYPTLMTQPAFGEAKAKAPAALAARGQK
jgi:hypothetical protein